MTDDGIRAIAAAAHAVESQARAAALAVDLWDRGGTGAVLMAGHCARLAADMDDLAELLGYELSPRERPTAFQAAVREQRREYGR